MTGITETQRSKKMNLKTKLRSLLVTGILAGMMVITGCATNTSIVKKENVAIERVDSGTARIGHAYLQASESGMVLRGELQRRFRSRGPIPGHLHIELIAPDGAAFKEATIGYRRMSVKSRIAKFHLEIPATPSDIKSVRIIHHDLRSHMSDSQESPWQDINQTQYVEKRVQGTIEI